MILAKIVDPIGSIKSVCLHLTTEELLNGFS
jgi:hypothetical protein